MVTATQGFSKLLVQKKRERHTTSFTIFFLPLASFWSIGSWQGLKFKKKICDCINTQAV